jgi:hypothetical protein
MKRQILLGLGFMLFGLFGCAPEPKNELVVLKGQRYLIPWQHEPEVSSGYDGIYVRIDKAKIAGSYDIQLLIDPMKYSIESKLGLPSLFGITGENKEELLSKLVKEDVKGIAVFCDKNNHGVGLHYGCGIRIQDKLVSWSVNFDEKDMQSVSQIKTDAIQLLKSYREAANAQPK